MKEKLYIIIQLAIIAFLLFLLFGCKTVQPISTDHNRDSVRVEVRFDSVYVYQHDSIFRDRWRNGDTVFVTIEKWQVKYKDKLVQVHDTICTTETNTEVQTIEVCPKFQRTCTWLFFILLIVVAGRIAWKVYRKFFL